MSKRPALFTEADIRRAARAIEKEGGKIAVKITKDGDIVEKLRDAAKLFLACADWVNETGQPDNCSITIFGKTLTAGECRALAAAIRKGEE